MKKILLVGDIGIGRGGFYHIGDELMFFYNYKVLIGNGYKVFVSSRSKKLEYTIKNDDIILDVNFSGFFRAFKLVIILFFYKFYPPKSSVKILIQTIKNVDDIIISGGGNLNSIRRGHLYYRFLITYFAKKYNKNVYLSSQTIGPIYRKLDFKMLDYILNYCKVISIRDINFSKKYIKDKFKYKTKYFWDDALIRDNLNSNFTYKSSNTFNVGLSLHKSGDNENLFEQISQIKHILESLYGNVKFYRIPHVFNDAGGYDDMFMKSIKFINYENNFCTQMYKSDIENIYKKMDFVITTRYHGGVLAAKYGKPVVMIGRTIYELGKFNGIIDLLHIKNYILLSNIDEISEKTIKSIIDIDSSLKYDKNKFFIYNYIGHYDKNRGNKGVGTKK